MARGKERTRYGRAALRQGLLTILWTALVVAQSFERPVTGFMYFKVTALVFFAATTVYCTVKWHRARPQ